MKNFFIILVATAMVLPFAGCSKHSDEIDNKIVTLTFEGDYWDTLIDDVQYGGPLLYGDMVTGTDYNWYDQGNTELASELCDNYGSTIYWNGGHAISDFVYTDLATCDYTLQLSVAKCDENGNGGYNGSKNFCVHNGYLSDFAITTGYFYFKDGKARVIDHLYLTSTTYYQSEVGKIVTSADWTKIIATGYDASSNVTGTAEFYITKDGVTVTDWTKWELSSVGAAVKVTFNFDSSMRNDYGLAIPAYFAYDDVAVVVE